MIIRDSRLVQFVHARLDDEEHDSALFHELDCPADPADQWCQCPDPRRLRDHIAIRRNIARTCERNLSEHDRHAPDWPTVAIRCWHILGALALPHECHPHWQEIWRP